MMSNYDGQDADETDCGQGTMEEMEAKEIMK